MIVPYLLLLFTCWSTSFPTEHTGQRAVRHALAWVMLLGRATITAVLRVLGQTGPTWHKEYRLYSHRRWNPLGLFDTILQWALRFCQDDYVVVALDDTSCGKTGKHIPGVHWGRDPQSPPFRINLRRQARFLHAAVLLPLYHAGATAARALPIRFEHAPPAPKPRKGATAEDLAQYKAAQAATRLPLVGWRLVRAVRAALDRLGQATVTLLFVVDGSYCTREFFRVALAGVQILARCRKDLRLCGRHAGGGRRFYSPETFTPEEIRQDETRPWQTGTFWYGGAPRTLRYKEVREVYWRRGADIGRCASLCSRPPAIASRGAVNSSIAIPPICSPPT